MEAFNQIRPHVILFPGRFQPLHNGHIDSFKSVHNLLGKSVMPVIIWKRPTENSPYPAEMIEEMFSSINEEWITKPIISSDVNLPNIVDSCRKNGYEPIGIACGIDRIDSYSRQTDKLVNRKYDTWVLKSFKIYEVDDRSHGISGTDIRKSISEGRDDRFFDAVPSVLHKFLNKLKAHHR